MLNNGRTCQVKCAALLPVLCFLLFQSVAAGERIVWKAKQEVVLRIGERAAGNWNVYEAEKRPGVLLVQFDRRLVLLDLKAHEALELDPESLVKSGTGAVWEDNRAEAQAEPDPARPGRGKPRRLKVEEWTVRDVGRADRIRVKLAGPGTVIDVQIVHPLKRGVTY